MSIWIRKIGRDKGKTRLYLPSKLMKSDLWRDVTYVSVEDGWGDRIVIRRAVIDEDAEEKAN